MPSPNVKLKKLSRRDTKMLVIYEIEGAGDLTPVMVAHRIGNDIGLPFEVVSMGKDDECVQLAIEVDGESIIEGSIDTPFNQWEE